MFRVSECKNFRTMTEGKRQRRMSHNDGSSTYDFIAPERAISRHFPFRRGITRHSVVRCDLAVIYRARAVIDLTTTSADDGLGQGRCCPGACVRRDSAQSAATREDLGAEVLQVENREVGLPGGESVSVSLVHLSERFSPCLPPLPRRDRCRISPYAEPRSSCPSF